MVNVVTRHVEAVDVVVAVRQLPVGEVMCVRRFYNSFHSNYGINYHAASELVMHQGQGTTIPEKSGILILC